MWDEEKNHRVINKQVSLLDVKDEAWSKAECIAGWKKTRSCI